MDPIDRQQAIDALWKALYKYEDEIGKQFQESGELDVGDWIGHRIFVQNMNDIDRKTIMDLPSAQPKIIHCKDCKHYHSDVFGQELGIEGLYGNLIVAHNACDKWSEHMNSVDPDGFCFLAERRTDAAK